MRTTTEKAYTEQADEVEGRDHTVKHKYADRAVQSEGAFGRAWLRYNPSKSGEQIWVTDLYGRDRWMTRGQVTMYQYLLTMVDAGHVTMRSIAEKLGVSVSTVYRTMVRLASWGLIAYHTGRGRYGGTYILRRTSRIDGLERFAQKARARVRRWYQAQKERISRSIVNVPPLYPRQETGTSDHDPRSTTHMDGTLKRAWSLEELREAGIV